MQQPKMIVLSLLGTGLSYGFEMEEFAQRTNMRQWAKIGMSTIYKALKDLEKEGAISVKIEESEKGPSRKAYSLTKHGRERMVELIRDALSSNMSVYSERIAGLVFARLMGTNEARNAISHSITGLEDADIALAASLKIEGMDVVGEAVVDYYRAIYRAERAAMAKVLAAL